jgi:hypothetical protein
MMSKTQKVRLVSAMALPLRDNMAAVARATSPILVFMVCSPESELAGMTKTDCQFHEVHFVG